MDRPAEHLLYTLEDLANRRCGSITGDGYILPCHPHHHGLMRDRLPKDHPYYVWCGRRWTAFLDWYEKRRLEITDLKEEMALDEEKREEKLVLHSRFHLEGGIRVMSMCDNWEIEGTAAGIEGHRLRLEKLLTLSPDVMRLSCRTWEITEDRRVEMQYDLPRQLR